MGHLIYGDQDYAFEDRVLAHLKNAIIPKLRKHEMFLLSWTKPAEEGAGRISILLSPGVSLTFRFAGGRPPKVNPIWVRALAATSHSQRGMTVMSEHEAEEYAKSHHI